MKLTSLLRASAFPVVAQSSNFDRIEFLSSHCLHDGFDKARQHPRFPQSGFRLQAGIKL
jgi:hypothetical protein